MPGDKGEAAELCRLILSDSARPQTSTWPRGSGWCPVPSCRMDTCHACSVMEEFVPPGDLLSPPQHGTEQCPQPLRGTAICHSPSGRACCKESSAPQRLIHCASAPCPGKAGENSSGGWDFISQQTWTQQKYFFVPGLKAQCES